MSLSSLPHLALDYSRSPRCWLESVFIRLLFLGVSVFYKPVPLFFASQFFELVLMTLAPNSPVSFDSDFFFFALRLLVLRKLFFSFPVSLSFFRGVFDCSFVRRCFLGWHVTDQRRKISVPLSCIAFPVPASSAYLIFCLCFLRKRGAGTFDIAPN